jgi:hypothetical protein
MPLRGVTTWLSANLTRRGRGRRPPISKRKALWSRIGRARRHELGFRPVLFLFGALFGTVFFNGGSLSSGLSARGDSAAVLTAVLRRTVGNAGVAEAEC